MEIDWNGIRPLNGGRDKGFEALCVQLAGAECPVGSNFVRKGSPDAGVECFAVLSDGSEWGWQAKYIDDLGDSQWSQLDNSVTTAIEKHPRLTKYFICTPLDRPDARIEGRKSAKDKWDDHVTKWESLARARALNIEFIYWGSHELLDRLSRPEHVGRLRFWFDKRGFDHDWFCEKIHEAIVTAGARYTPEVHIELPIAQEFDAFGRTNRFFDRLKSKARPIRARFRSLESSRGKTNASVDEVLTELSEVVEVVLKSLGAITQAPYGLLPFNAIIENISTAQQKTSELLKALEDGERDCGAALDPVARRAHGHQQNNPFQVCRSHSFKLESELRETEVELVHADGLSNRALMLLSGVAGSGKTHLLCDIAKQRIAAGLPTVLMMGQRFINNDPPWTQALQHLDLPRTSVDEFVGALESAAQIAGARALVMIDAINEGAGRAIWPDHAASFLGHLERSPWIGVVLSVRSSYEEICLPAEVRARATAVTHHGFEEHEYDATQSYFAHYELELPSTPLLVPEFRNPLFLKTLCQGLHENGIRRLPRGFQGITGVFDLHLQATNKRLAKRLDFDPKDSLVNAALVAMASAELGSGLNWLTVENAKSVVNQFLQGRDFRRSLYSGLIDEGVLVEQNERQEDGTRVEVVHFAYERFGDHLIAKGLVDSLPDGVDLREAFALGGPLAFIGDQKVFVTPGLLEALCIQFPERTGVEMVSIEPGCAERWGFTDAFLQSVVWRDFHAFTEATTEVIVELCSDDYGLRQTIETFLTTSTLPEHKYNARYLDKWMREYKMPDRDSWWSVALHDLWDTHSSVDRIVDWAFTRKPQDALDEDVVDLCAIALAWMLSTSNRFLRDRVTTALVNLLAGRGAAMTKLVERFADVDDPYISERVYAVAYGVAMRCHQRNELGVLAARVYEIVFAPESTPPHVLLRDYARGVIERALYLGSSIDVDPARIRPPYRSLWPEIPSEKDIELVARESPKGSWDSGELEWGRNRIRHSVLNDDFAFYVIGTNSSATSSYWLSLKLDEPAWQPPPDPRPQLETLVGELSDDERRAWCEFDVADKEFQLAYQLTPIRWELFQRADEAVEGLEQSMDDATAKEDGKALLLELKGLEEARRLAEETLTSVLTAEHSQRFREITLSQKLFKDSRHPPMFELNQIQRYILARVFELGWTEERFGRFDRYSIGYQGRSASKPERIGKKYQWIAYHEILAYISDHFQYREEFRDDQGDQAYLGPWQVSERDIDPSCTLRTVFGETSWKGHSASWWDPAGYSAFGDPVAPRDWVQETSKLPKLDELLVVTNPVDQSRWVNGYGFFSWVQQPPVDLDSADVERRELWYISTGYLLAENDASTFLSWAEGVHFWGRWMPGVPDVTGPFVGEHGWAPAFHYFQDPYYGGESWVQPRHDCPVKLRTVATGYLREASGFNCSIDESFTLHLPISEIVSGLDIRWSGHGADFVDAEGRITALDPTVHEVGPTALLLKEDRLQEFLSREKLVLCWIVTGEKRVIPPGMPRDLHHPTLQISGACVLSDGRVNGFVKHLVNDISRSNQEDQSSRLEIINIERYGA